MASFAFLDVVFPKMPAWPRLRPVWPCRLFNFRLLSGPFGRLLLCWLIGMAPCVFYAPKQPSPNGMRDPPSPVRFGKCPQTPVAPGPLEFPGTRPLQSPPLSPSNLPVHLKRCGETFASQAVQSPGARAQLELIPKTVELRELSLLFQSCVSLILALFI